MRLRYHQFCPLAKAAEVLGERWTLLIVRELLQGTRRYRDFQRALSRISPSMLTKRLRQLVDCGLAQRIPAAGGTPVEYRLTAAGEELRPIVYELTCWGMRWARGQMRPDELDVHLLMYDWCRLIDASRLPPGRTVLGFVFPGLPQFSRWWIVLDPPKERELCAHHPGSEADVELRADLRTMVEIWAGDLEIAAARRDGRLQLSGAPQLVRTLSAWLRPSLVAHIRPHPSALKV